MLMPNPLGRLARLAARPVRRLLRSSLRRLPRRYATPTAGALGWLRAQELPDGGIRVHSRHPRAYPEVTGYLVPTLLDYGQTDLAARSVRWLTRIQKPDGAFADPDRDRPYLFDTGQALRGLLAGLELDPEAPEAARRAADYLHAQMLDGGRGGFRLGYADGEADAEAGGISESIHLYVLPPLLRAAEALGRPDLADAARRCRDHYGAGPGVLDPGDLTHFLAYRLEALIDLGRPDLAAPVLDALQAAQGADGAVHARPSARWVCTPGLAQLAVWWYKTGAPGPAGRALDWLEKHQEPSGGFEGSYGPGATYFPGLEISWAVKYYLDAARLRAGDAA